MAVQRPQEAGHVLGFEAGLIQQPREQMMDQHVLRSVDALRRVHRLLHADHLAPPHAAATAPPRDGIPRPNHEPSGFRRYVPPPAGRTPSATTTPYPGNRFASPRASAARPPACPSHGWIYLASR